MHHTVLTPNHLLHGRWLNLQGIPSKEYLLELWELHKSKASTKIEDACNTGHVV